MVVMGEGEDYSLLQEQRKLGYIWGSTHTGFCGITVSSSWFHSKISTVLLFLWLNFIEQIYLSVKSFESKFK